MGMGRSSSSFGGARFAGSHTGHKGPVFPRERGGVVAGNVALLFPAQKPCEQSRGVIEAGTVRHSP